ncbi:MAG: outer membrane beta-barrel protein [Saprospiraceae bacterium]
MKKIALLLFFATLMLGKSVAQNRIRFGVQTSPSWSWLKTSERDLEGVSSNWGIKLGAMSEFYFADNYALTTGLGFGFNQGGSLQNGFDGARSWVPWDKEQTDLSDLPSDTFGVKAKLHYRINYVEIPFGLKMRGGSNEDSRIKFYAELPIFTLGFVTKATGDIRGTNDQNLEDINIREEVKGLSLSWGLGGGIEYEFATNATLVTGLVYQKQFTDLTRNGFVQDNGTWRKEDSKATFGNIALKIGVFF